MISIEGNNNILDKWINIRLAYRKPNNLSSILLCINRLSIVSKYRYVIPCLCSAFNGDK